MPSMTEPATPSEGLGVVHLFFRVSPLVDRDAALTAIASAQADGNQVITVSVLGHKADLAVMALGTDLWRLRRLQTDLAAAGLDLVDSFVSITEVSEYAAGVPDEMKQARLYPQLPPEGRLVQLITSSTGLDDYEWGVTLFAVRPDDLKDVVYTMRFDQASAVYAEFGPFFVGMVGAPEAVLDSVGVV